MRNLSLLFGFEQLLAVRHSEEEQLCFVSRNAAICNLSSVQNDTFLQTNWVYFILFFPPKSCSECLLSAVFLSKNSWRINNCRVSERESSMFICSPSFGGCHFTMSQRAAYTSPSLVTTSPARCFLCPLWLPCFGLFPVNWKVRQQLQMVIGGCEQRAQRAAKVFLVGLASSWK